MRSQRLKDLYFTLIRPLAKVNAWRLAVRCRLGPRSAGGKLFLNLGCGDRYAEGLVNIEGNILRKKDMWLDLRNRLPFSDESVDGIYACHVLEHFYTSEVMGILRECRRVLRPHGVIRILVPSLEKAVQAYAANDAEWFPDSPSEYQSLGGRFFNYVLCEGQHRLAFDFSFLNELLTEAGFPVVRVSERRKSLRFPPQILEGAEDPTAAYVQTSLIVEAQTDE